MSRYQPPQPPPPNGMDASRLHQRHSGDFRSHAQTGNGALPLSSMPNGRVSNGHPASSNKNTSHVPCKFFRQGTCQAGKACPFSHSTEPTTETPCKYFQKGNCKFGYKCALAHILPNGQRAPSGNYRPGMGMGGNPLNLGGRLSLHHPPEATATSSLLTMQQAHLAQPQPPPFLGPPEDPLLSQGSQQRAAYDVIPTIDTTFSSLPGSNYGSPPHEGRLAISPAQRGLSVMDAPLPASFDSQGVSHMARYGPIAASVPSRFGLESSPPSSLPKKAFGDSSTLRNLHSSAFGDDSRSTRNGLLATSPPITNDDPADRRIMHSERFTRPKMLSASLGARTPLGGAAVDDWDEGFAFEEDFLPTSLHDLLTPQEKMRRFSRNGADEDTININNSNTLLSHRHSLSGLASPADSTSKVGSPSTASPSRFGALFSRTHPKPAGTAAAAAADSLNDLAPLSSPAGPSAFGHVGSPLRASSLHPGASPALRASASPRPPSAASASGAGGRDAGPTVASPPRQASMSIISQQLQRTRLSSRAAAEAPEPALHPVVAARLGERAPSSSSVGRAERIVEEDGAGAGAGGAEAEQELFSIDDVEPRAARDRRKDGAKRVSGGWGFSVGGRGSASPSFGPLGSGGGGGGSLKGLGSESGKERPWNNDG